MTAAQQTAVLKWDTIALEAHLLQGTYAESFVETDATSATTNAMTEITSMATAAPLSVVLRLDGNAQVEALTQLISALQCVEMASTKVRMLVTIETKTVETAVAPAAMLSPAGLALVALSPISPIY